MTPIEWFAAILAIWVFIKFLLLQYNPRGFMKWGAKTFGKHVAELAFVYLLIFFVLSYYLIQEITIVQLFTAMLAGMLLMAHTMAHYPKVVKFYIGQFKGKNPNAKIMFDWLIWLVI
ncbi:MAG: hypothetical protein ACE5FT_00750, partial [Candidatus Nanoarchaeia archaeon]